MNLVSDKRRADDRRLICVRQSRVVLAPVAGVKFAEARRLDRAWTNLNPLMTVTRRIRSPGRARNKPLKPLRAGMPGDLGATCGDYARVLHLNSAREAMGASRTRHSPRPLFSWGASFLHNSGDQRRGNAEVRLMKTNAPDSQPSSSATG